MLHARSVIAAAAAVLLLASAAMSQRANPFTRFGGSWTGGGLIVLANGTKERIRCRAGFTPADIFNVISLRLELRCAGDAYNFELQSDLNYDAGSITGTWTELSRGVNGRVTGTIRDHQINAVAESPTFTATLDLINLGDKQQVRITSPGSEITDVLIGLNLRSRSPGPIPQ
jgi:hypothetical protein